MLCSNPYMLNGKAFGCGQCLPCRVNRRRIWANRITLEAAQYGDNTFATLTYDDDHLPAGSNLDPLALTLFLKRLRKWFDVQHGRKFRYFGVGEYGDKSERPHYHLALFGFPNCERGRTRPGTKTNPLRSCCTYCDAVRQVWGNGMVELAPLEPGSANYVAGYVTKKLTAKDDDRLEGRHPEFARMSNRPGIGAGIMDEVASAIMMMELEYDDAPGAVGIGARKYPIGRYLQKNLRKKLGRDEKTPPEKLAEMDEKLRPLREIAQANAARGHKIEYLKTLITEANAGKRIRLEAKYRRSPRRGNI